MTNPSTLPSLIETLREKCPYDRGMTLQKIVPDLIEEVHELIDALVENNEVNIQEELGDTLFQLYFIGALLSVKDADLQQSAQQVIEKMVRRHPHVFDNVTVETVADIRKNWAKIKSQEKSLHEESITDGIPVSLPALEKAQQLSVKIAKTGFDWQEMSQVLEQLSSEITEFTHAVEKYGKESPEVTLELGDILFTVVNLARFSGVCAENALLQTISKVKKRFKEIEKKAKEEHRSLETYSMEELENFWQQAKEKTDVTG